MESGPPYPNKDDPSAFASVPLISNQSELTPKDKKHAKESEITKDDAASKLIGPSTSNQIEYSKQNDIQNDQTNNCNQSKNYNSYENHAFVPSDPEDKRHTSNEIVIFHENQDYNPSTILNKVNEINLSCESILPIENYDNCDNSSNQENKNDILSLDPKYLNDLNKGAFSNQFHLCGNISNSNEILSENDCNSTENIDSNTHEIIQNNGGRRNSSISFNEIPFDLEQISIISEQRENFNDQISDTTITPKSSVSSDHNPLSKIVAFVIQEPETGSMLTLQGKNRSPIRRLSKRRLSQWGKRKTSYPKGKTYVHIVEGVNEKHLWSEARKLKRPALFVLWWSALAMFGCIASIYDVFSDSSVAYFFYNEYYKHREKGPELVWCIFSIIWLVSSYLLQCCFSFYEVTHGGRKNFGRLSKKKYSIPLFFLMPWIIIFIGVYDTYKNRYTWRLETAYIMMFIEVIFESLPQASLQLNAIIVYEHDPDKSVTPLQWCSVTSSIIFLSMGIAYSVIFYNNENVTQKIKSLFCVFGGITVVSRILLCSSWALRARYLWLLPFGTGLITTSMTWLALRTFSCFGYKEYLTKYDINSLPMALVTASSFVTSYIFNCFSPSGILVSVVMYALAVIDFQLKINDSEYFGYNLHIVNICLTTFVLMCNIVFSFVPKCCILSQRWIEGEGEDEDDPYHFRFY